ncbi:acyl-CoA dehydrogenase family protein [Pseudomonas sp. 25 R 14]|uniref:acyl-CoA dehydrogenase family protein n=1 Tax=Pseudomonas sp. 25 R 14 TaxID=1844109 RepID=UPI0008120A9B|nr:acyl-CoA dehydrogenase family protein [Pseudomonas sp. 25 R 14]CRM75501.1 Acyl-CoA dehydrogenase [Pseudomonas sp. 25 R 14]
MGVESDQAELQLFRDNVHRFIQSQIVPHYERWEKEGIVPRELWRQLGEAGLLCVDVPEAFGGAGASFEFSMVVAQEMGLAGCGALGASLMVHSDIVAHYILNAGTDEQKNAYLPKMVTGECVGAIAMTEPGAGSDLQGIRTRARQLGDHYVINGSKTFITNGQHCDLVIVAARTNPDVAGAKGISLLIVESGTQGFERGRNLDKVGCHCADTSELFFQNVHIPTTAMLGGLNQGFMVLMNELQRERVSLATMAVAAAEGALALTVDYVKERKAFGGPLAQLQNTRFKLAEMQTDMRVHKAFVSECRKRFAEGTLDVASVSMAKLGCTEMQGRVVDGCLQLFGGYGYISEYPISRAYVDARVQRIYGGTSEIMKEIIARDVLK